MYDEPLQLAGTVGRFITCIVRFKKELSALEQTVKTYITREKPSRPLNRGRAVLFFSASALLSAPSVKNVLDNVEDRTSYLDFAERWRRKVKLELQESERPKAQNFVECIDLMLCIPPIDFAIKNGNPVQGYVLLASILVKKHFPAVTRVEKAVVWVLIFELLNSGSRRRAENVVFRSADPAGDTFSVADLPHDIIEQFGSDNVVRIARGKYYSFPN